MGAGETLQFGTRYNMKSIYSVFKKCLIFGITAFILCVPLTFAAFDCSAWKDKLQEPNAIDSVLYLICPLQTGIIYGLYFVGAVLIIMVLYGGIKAIMSTGDSRQLEGAKMVWTYAILGTLVILLSITIVQIAFGLLGSSNNPLSITDNLKSSFDGFMNALNP
jgi:hypothetical protein